MLELLEIEIISNKPKFREKPIVGRQIRKARSIGKMFHICRFPMNMYDR